MSLFRDLPSTHYYGGKISSSRTTNIILFKAVLSGGERWIYNTLLFHRLKQLVVSEEFKLWDLTPLTDLARASIGVQGVQPLEQIVLKRVEMSSWNEPVLPEGFVRVATIPSADSDVRRSHVI